MTKKQIASRLAEINRGLRKMEADLQLMQKPMQEGLLKIIYCIDKMTSMWDQPVNYEEFIHLSDRYNKENASHTDASLKDESDMDILLRMKRPRRTRKKENEDEEKAN